MDKLAVIFGGGGFIGRHLSKALVQNNYKVIIADISEPPFLHLNEEFVFCDVRKEIFLNTSRTPEVVFNLAAVHRTPGHQDYEYFETNVFGAINITKWCDSVGAVNLVFCSSISVYGPSFEKKSELSTPEPESSYGKSKYLAEQIHLNWAKSPNFERKITIARPAAIFGPGEKGNFTRLSRAIQRRTFFYPASPGIIKASGFVVDLCRALIFVSGRPDKEVIFNFSFPRSYSIGEISKAIAFTLGARTPLVFPLFKLLQGLPIDKIGFKNLRMRILKLVVPTIIEPKVLIELGFKWNFDLSSAMESWKSMSESDRYLA